MIGFPFQLADAPLILWYIGVLAFLEGLLSADNALVLALMVRHLPKREQRRVLFYGIWGAVGFRVIALLLSAFLLKFWFFKVLGGLYLLYLATSHFLSTRDDQGIASGAEGFMSTVSTWLGPPYWCRRMTALARGLRVALCSVACNMPGRCNPRRPTPPTWSKCRLVILIL